MKNVAVFGSGGAIGSALVLELLKIFPEASVHAFSSSSAINIPQVNSYVIDYCDESQLQQHASAFADSPLDLIFVATGVLHVGDVMPEKSLRDLSAEKFRVIYEANTITPSLIAKHFLPKLNKASKSLFAALSARVGSVSDNRLGGWYSYRASKAALNMVIKNLAIEIKRTNKHAVVVGLHPGTVASNLSKPFQHNVPTDKLFSAEFSANQLLSVLNGLDLTDSGKLFAWDGQEVIP